jgi:hypothetical protein
MVEDKGLFYGTFYLDLNNNMVTVNNEKLVVLIHNASYINIYRYVFAKVGFL